MRTNKDRAYPRMRATTRVDWHVAGSATHVVSNLGNVSAGGVYVETSLGAHAGAPVELHLLTDVGAVPVKGRVAWSDDTGMGIRFDS